MIESGYCIYAKDFFATVEEFRTISVEYAHQTVPLCLVILKNGVELEMNETELVFSKEELDIKCFELNKQMQSFRENWLNFGLPALRRNGLA